MKRKTALNVDVIGGLGELTPKEENVLSAYISKWKNKRAKKREKEMLPSPQTHRGAKGRAAR